MTTALCNEAHRWGSRPTLSLLHAVAASLVTRLPARLVALRRHVVEPWRAHGRFAAVPSRGSTGSLSVFVLTLVRVGRDRARSIRPAGSEHLAQALVGRPATAAALDAIAVAIGNLTNLRKLDLRSFTAAGGADEARRERVRKAAREGATVMF